MKVELKWKRKKNGKGEAERGRKKEGKDRGKGREKMRGTEREKGREKGGKETLIKSKSINPKKF